MTTTATPTRKPYNLTKKGVGAACEAQNGSRVVTYEPGPLAHAPRRFRTIHTVGFVYREGSYGWTAWRGPGKPELGGYATRAAAAEVLWQDWMAENFALAQRIVAHRGGSMTAALRCRRCDDLHILNAEHLCPDCVEVVDREFVASRPNCIACGDWDETVAEVRITRAISAPLCRGCAANDEVLRVLTEEAEA